LSKFVIFGAGKIARGFIGQLLFLSGHEFVFVEKFQPLVDMLNQRGGYHVRVLGAPEKDSFVTPVKAVSLDDQAAINAAVAEADAVFTAVGGKNLDAIAAPLAEALNDKCINVVTCENWKKPAAQLQKAVQAISPACRAGFAESVVMRSAIEPSAEALAEDPLTVNVQNYWHLPIDAASLAAPLPEVKGMEPIDSFSGFLERKFYTYNAANGTTSYVGSLLGFTHVAEAAKDERVHALLNEVYAETGRALSIRHNIDFEEQMAFAGTSYAKLSDEVIVDTLERNARDPLRKLGPDDRLVGSARLAESYGIIPHGLCTAIAAALHYQSPQDPSALELNAMMHEHGSEWVLENICKLEKGSPLAQKVLECEAELKKMGWLK